MNPLCKLFGHTEAANDSGYPVCGRCGAHAYYDNEQWQKGMHGILRLDWLIYGESFKLKFWKLEYWLMFNRYRWHIFNRCPGCNKAMIILGKQTSLISAMVLKRLACVW